MLLTATDLCDIPNDKQVFTNAARVHALSLKCTLEENPGTPFEFNLIHKKAWVGPVLFELWKIEMSFA